MEDAAYNEIKHLTAKLYSLCNLFWPDEFKKMYRANPEAFREWLNRKTNLQVDHLKFDKLSAIKAWVNAIDHIVR